MPNAYSPSGLRPIPIGMGRSTEAREYIVKRSWLLVACALIALFATSAFAFGAEPVPPFDTNTECLQCHSVSASGSAVTKVDFTVVGGVALEKCASCHSGNYLDFAHPHFTGDCVNCHNNDDAFYFPWPGSREYPVNTPYGHFLGLASLSATPARLHAIHSQTGSWVNQSFGESYPACASCHATAACTACHEAPVAHGDHAAPTYPGRTLAQANGIAAPVVTSTCIDPACHSLAVAGTAAFTPSCGSCHPTNVSEHGYEAPMHTADVTATVDAGGKVCGDCHEMELYAEHQRATSTSKAAACGACHPAARGTFAAWDQTCAQGGCHAAGSPTAAHGDIAAGHAPLTTGDSAVCTSCHTAGDLGSIHASAVSDTDTTKTSCLVCHSNSSVPSTKDCTTCHFTNADHPYPAASHRSSWTLTNCGGAGCHSTRDLLGVHTENNAAFGCADCHGSTNPKVIAALGAGLTGCGDCHEGVTQTSGHDAQHWANPLLSDGSGPHYGYETGSASTAPTSDCAGCHTSNLIAEHVGAVDAATGNPTRSPRYDSQGDALTCASCHSALAGSLVANAIATGQTKCDACHVTHKQIPATHTSTFVADPAVPCAPCHSAQIEYSHDGTYTTTTVSGKTLTGCEVCHANYEGTRGAQVQAAISDTNDTKCTACHAATHPDKGGHIATAPESIGCGACHAANQATVDIRSLHPSCATCHENPNRIPNIAEKTGECASCHSSEGVNYHTGLPGKHVDGTMAATCQSTTCHVNSLPEAHEGYIASQSTYDTTCALCHANTDSSRIPSDATAACASCHASIHPNMDHTARASQACVDCHETGDVMALHKTGNQTDCALCHGSAARVAPLPATVDCVNCHADVSPADPKHYDATTHTAADGAEYGYACSKCHSMDMKTAHVGFATCVQCHEAKVDNLSTAWNKQCATCHTSRHASMTASHVSSNTSCGGTGCHAINDVASVHGATASNCGVCHGAGKTPTTNCTVCHGGDAHTVREPYQNCASSGCHSLPVIHGYTRHQVDCSKCHGDSAGGCVQSGCHSENGVHSVSRHESQPCQTCHTSGANVVREPFVGCADCHASDIHGESDHQRAGCQTCHGAFAPGCTKTGCHSMSEIHGEGAHESAGCKRCHTSGVAKPHTQVTSKLANTTSSWKTVCSSCHGRVHDRGTCWNCHEVPGDSSSDGGDSSGWGGDSWGGSWGGGGDLHGISGHTGSASKCKGCHTVPSASQSLDCTWCHPGGKSTGSPINTTVGTIDGVVTDSAGTPLAGATVSAGSVAAVTGTDGKYTLAGITPGNVVVAASAAGYLPQSSTVLVVKDLHTIANFQLVKNTGTLVGTVTDASTGALLSGVTVLMTGGPSATTAANGTYSFNDCTAGTYTVTYSKTGYTSQTKSVTVSAGQTTTASVALVPIASAANLALNKTATASSTYSTTYSAAKAFDGSATTYWRSTSAGTQWLRIDLGSSQSFKKFVIDWNGSAYARAYRIETSADGSNWTSRYSTSSGNGDATVTLTSAVNARYVRLYCTSGNSSSYQVAECQVWSQ